MKTKTFLSYLGGTLVAGALVLTADYSPQYRINERDFRDDFPGVEQIIYYEKIEDVSQMFVFSEDGELIFQRPLLQTDMETPFGSRRKEMVTSHDYADSKLVTLEELSEKVRGHLLSKK